MPRVSRAPRQVQDRPGRGKLLWRRVRRLLPSTPWLVAGGGVAVAAFALIHTAMPGGRPARSVAQHGERLGSLSRTLGWRVRDVIVSGRVNTPEPLLHRAIDVSPGDPVLGVSLAAMRQRVEGLSWVAHATVERRLPGTIVVALTEHVPYAIWQHQGRFRLIDRAGDILTDPVSEHEAGQNYEKFQSLPLVVGAGAPQYAADLLDALAKYPPLQAKVVAAVRVGERRWNLRMQNGMDVLLPEGHAPAALARLMSLQATHDLLDRPLQVIDMRLPDRLVLRARPDLPADEANSASSRSAIGAGESGRSDGSPSAGSHRTGSMGAGTRDGSPGNGRHGARSLARNAT